MKHSKTYFVSLIFISSLFIGIFIPVSNAMIERKIVFTSETPSVSPIDVTFNYNAPSHGKAEHWAIITGISDYKLISDLNFCDEDANDWYTYFVGLGYEHIIVLGDHSNDYYQLDFIASEYNIKQTLSYVVANADEDDVISFVTSGHGSRDKIGESLICAWDYGAGENGEDGVLWDYELASIFELAIAEQIFIFIDHCFAGGFGPDFLNLPNSENIYFAAACTEKGLGWDAPQFNNGLWTYYFLEFTLTEYFNSKPRTTMEEAFAYAQANFPYHTGVMIPEEYDGNLDQVFLLI
jgi:hypothetical protein